MHGTFHGGQAPEGLQHHISAEPPLRMTQQSPLFWAEVHSQRPSQRPPRPEIPHTFYFNNLCTSVCGKWGGPSVRKLGSIPRPPEHMVSWETAISKRTKCSTLSDGKCLEPVSMKRTSVFSKQFPQVFLLPLLLCQLPAVRLGTGTGWCLTTPSALGLCESQLTPPTLRRMPKPSCRKQPQAATSRPSCRWVSLSRALWLLYAPNTFWVVLASAGHYSGEKGRRNSVILHLLKPEAGIRESS